MMDCYCIWTLRKINFRVMDRQLCYQPQFYILFNFLRTFFHSREIIPKHSFTMVSQCLCRCHRTDSCQRGLSIKTCPQILLVALKIFDNNQHKLSCQLSEHLNVQVIITYNILQWNDFIYLVNVYIVQHISFTFLKKIILLITYCYIFL